MIRLLAVTAALALLGMSIVAQANVFGLGTGLTNLETVLVADPGNAADTRYGGGHGSVSYQYSVGKYEVTAAQYCDFLNAVAKTDTYRLYISNMWSEANGCKIQRFGNSGSYSYSVAADWANRPVNYVNYWSSCRFANWLGNGQPTGLQNASTTERGAYNLDGYSGSDGRTIGGNAGWKWAVTSEEEWYKAAYYKGAGTNSGYWTYPTRSAIAPSNVGADGYTDPGSHANYDSNGSAVEGGYTIGSPYYRTNVGEFENSASAYGTFDQGGNIAEWTESFRVRDESAVFHIRRGGSFSSLDTELAAWNLASCLPDIASPEIGFRVSVVPEPSSLSILAACFLSVFGLRRRKG